MKPLDAFYRLLRRFRYPVSLPEEVATSLGIPIPEFISFDSFVGSLSSPSCHPTRLKRFMPRNEAEAVFHGAQMKETFNQNTLISYYFNEGWLEFILYFDEMGLLRRMYMQHRQITEERGIEIHLD